MKTLLFSLLILCTTAWAEEPGKVIVPPVTMNAFTAQPPLAAHGVIKCGEVIVLWILKEDDDGQIRFYRTDSNSHPDTAVEYDAFLKWVGRTPKDQSDVYTLPCEDKPQKNTN